MDYGMWRVDRDYVNKLRARNPDIVDPDVTNLYVGPLIDMDGVWGFYAPVFANPDRDFYVNLDENALISGFINVVKMIPCRAEILTRTADNSPEGEFCITNRAFIEACAQYALKADKELHRGKTEEQ